MCGIAGLLDAAPAFDADSALETGRRMASVLHHRGPDGGGILVDPAHGAMLSHRRLAVVELGAAGAQPMLSRSGNTAIVFNGEIYNFRALRTHLTARTGGVPWRGDSDTEFLVESIEAIGLDATLADLSGMFAFAVLDRRSGRMTLVRDRYGEKPLYFRAENSKLVFGSDADPIIMAGASTGIDPRSLRDLFSYGFVRQPRSIYAGIEQVPPGCHITFERRGGRVVRDATQRYWSVTDEARRAIDAGPRLAGAAAEAKTEQALSSAVQDQMLADVPVGALLSGGIDSSLVVALMQRQSAQRVRTFTIGFSEQAYDESAHAEAVARHLGTDHTTFLLRESDALGMIGDVVQAYAEPFANSSQIPTYCVARMARSEVTTVLTGDGGDEVFGGYNRHVFAATAWHSLARIPLPARRLAARAIGGVARPSVAGLWDDIGSRLSGAAQTRRSAEKLVKFGNAIAAGSLDDYHERLLRLGTPAGRFLSDDARSRADAMSTDARSTPPAEPTLTPAEQLMARDAEDYLPNDILVKVDRATMAVSLEFRAPFLDRHVAAVGWQLAPGEKIANGIGKQVLRRLLARHLPRELFERPKTGFSVPLGRWLRTGVADLANHHFEPHRLAQSGMLDVAEITTQWDRHQRETVDAAAELWPVLMFQAWLERRPRAGPQPRVLQRLQIAGVRDGDPAALLELTS